MPSRAYFARTHIGLALACIFTSALFGQDELPFSVQVPAPADPIVREMSIEELTRRLLASEEKLAALQSGRADWIENGGEEPEFVAMADKSDKPASDKPKDGDKAKEKPKTKAWYEKLSVRGYTQFRFTDSMWKEPDSAAPQNYNDSSISDGQTFLIRRARLVLSGNVTDRIYLYVQPEFAASPNGTVDNIHFVSLRDLYADLHFDEDKEHRIRVGLSKVPFGWENLQSSQNRAPLDRNDAINSATRNERDLGIFYYWTPQYAQEIYKYVSDNNLKGSGNYGVFGVGVYDGQGGSLAEQNDSLHVAVRYNVPIQFEDCQVVEFGAYAYTGKYTVLSSTISPLGVGAAVRPFNTLETNNRDGIVDQRVGASFVYFPQPLGFQAEWNIGRGPALNDAQTAVTSRSLTGGYAMVMYRQETECWGEFLPYCRWTHFRGGHKSERNAPFAKVDELEAGVEWQINKNVELTAAYAITDRTNTRANSVANTLSYNQYDGQLMRFQLQINY